jgi:hypothetical protein
MSASGKGVKSVSRLNRHVPICHSACSPSQSKLSYEARKLERQKRHMSVQFWFLLVRPHLSVSVYWSTAFDKTFATHPNVLRYPILGLDPQVDNNCPGVCVCVCVFVCLWFSRLRCNCHIHCPFYSLFNYHNNIIWRLKIRKLVIMQFSRVQFILPGSKYLSQRFVSLNIFVL